MSKIIIFFITLIVVATASYLVRQSMSEDLTFEEEISNFEECVAAGYVVMESYPRQCRTEDNQTFIENIGNELEKIDVTVPEVIRTPTPPPEKSVNLLDTTPEDPALIKELAPYYGGPSPQ